MNQNTSILLITLRADIGGGPKHVFELAQEIIKRNQFKVFIASPNQKPFGNQFKSMSANHLEMPFRKFSIITFLRLIAFCFRHKINLIHSHGRGAGIYSRMMKLFGFKIIHTYHGIHQEPGLKGWIKIKIDLALEYFSDVLIFVSASELKNARNVGLGKNLSSIVVENGILPLGVKHNRIRGKVLGNLARLTFQKGQEILIDYFHELVRIYPNDGYHLCLGGAGEDDSKLQSRISELGLQDKVTLIGEVTDIKSFFESIDLYVSNSRWEGLPLSVLEAMFLKVPCVLSNVIGHEEFLLAGAARNGTSKNDFLEAVNDLANSDENYKKIANSAFSYVTERHTIDSQVNKIETIYKRLT